MTANTYYKMTLAPDVYGLVIFKQIWISIHETPCFDYCVRQEQLWRVNLIGRTKITPLQYAREKKILKRIHKQCSRFAFNTEEQALEHLKFLKRKQLQHMKRDCIFVEAFLATEELEPCGDFLRVPKTENLVHEYYNFDC